MKSTNIKYFIAALLVIFAFIVVISSTGSKKVIEAEAEPASTSGVCPPFHLYDEDGNIIDPVNGINADKPYSPRKTCGASGCHDYELITEGYHFQQGKDEVASGMLAERYQWVSHPGNYGGNWCSPGTLYNSLAPKENTNETEIDMTSFTFITSGCGSCHPGGASLEFDRNGFRYDKYMDSVGYVAGGKNDLDGDYYKSHWNRSGVIEADCNLCHLPSYNYSIRNSNLRQWNFRWMATAGSGLAKVEGSVKDSLPIKVTYDVSKFDKNGKLSLHLVREVRNETCLNCHSKPGWKKRGASFDSKRDVHLNAGLKCVDCHSAGRDAFDERVRGKEVHQFGKGDCPSGHVRNDLDNTLRTCESCHLDGYLNTPIAKHSWLPPLHFDKLSCQACHISERSVKAALMQASDVYNSGPKITPPEKRIWTFYDPNLNYWNHYGDFSMFKASDQPTYRYVPNLAKYKGKIFPMNMVHGSWPAIYTEGKPGLAQPKMKDIYEMWAAHNNDPKIYPNLALITDDNNDGVIEINRPEEIDAYIESVTDHLTKVGYDLAGKQVVWAYNDLMYLSGTEYKTMDKENWEASPYSSVHKYSHDIPPAKAALGINGCTDCHSLGANFFFADVIRYPFDENGNPITIPQYEKLEISAFFSYFGAIREQFVKPLMYSGLGLLFVQALLFFILGDKFRSAFNIKRMDLIYIAVITITIAFFTVLAFSSDMTAYLLPSRLLIDGNHFLIGSIVFIIGIFSYMYLNRNKILLASLFITILSGIFMLLGLNVFEFGARLAYSLFDLSLLTIIVLTILSATIKQIEMFDVAVVNKQD